MLKIIKANIDSLRQNKSKYFKKCMSFSFFSKYFQINKTIAYCNKALNTKKLHAIIHVEIEVTESVFGDIDVMLLKLLIKTRYIVMSKAIRSKLRGITKLN